MSDETVTLKKEELEKLVSAINVMAKALENLRDANRSNADNIDDFLKKLIKTKSPGVTDEQ